MQFDAQKVPIAWECQSGTPRWHRDQAPLAPPLAPPRQSEAPGGGGTPGAGYGNAIRTVWDLSCER